VMELVYMYA